MEETIVNLYNVKSIAQILEESKISKVRKALLRFLIPKEFYRMPVHEILKLQKGTVIGKLSISLNEELPESIDIGFKMNEDINYNIDIED